MTDIRYALRGFRHNPAFTLTALIVIGLGIGSTTAVFSVVDRNLFRSLPYAHGDRLVTAGMTLPWVPGGEFVFGPSYLAMRDSGRFEAVTSWTGIADCDLTEASPLRLSCARVESTFLATAGLPPLIGRDFTREDDRPQETRQVLISYGLWQGRFGGDLHVAGRTVSIDGQISRIAGVLPVAFEMPTLAHVDMVVPQGIDDAGFRRNLSGMPIRVLARVRAGETPQQAEAALGSSFSQTLVGIPPEARKQIKLTVRALRDFQTRDVRLASWVLLGAVFAVLLIACANVANLLLVRSVGRRREIEVRLALGASRLRLMRQTLVESLVLGMGGATAGVLLAYWLLRWIVTVAPQSIPRLGEATLDLRVLGFAVVASIVSAGLFGLAPALRVLPNEPKRGGFVRHSFAATQIAVSLVLLTSAGLLLRTLWNLQNAPLGMRADNLLTAALSLSPARYPGAVQQLRFFEEVEERFSALPGFVAVAVSDSLPPVTPSRSRPYFALDPNATNQGPRDPGAAGMVGWRAVTPGYFAALGIPILRGRGFGDADRNPGEKPVILSDSLARRLFPGADPVGKRVMDSYTVVGVAAEVRNNGSLLDDPEYYVVRNHAANDAMYNAPGMLRRGGAVIRTSLAPRAAADMIRAAVAAIEPTIPVAIEGMPERVYQLAERPRFNAILLGLFAGMGLVMAAVGLYGVVSFLVVQRRREMGIRIALGATSGGIVRLVLSEAGRWVLAGSAIGVAGSMAAARLMASMLSGVAVDDRLAMAAPVSLLLLIALAAAWIPARKAAGVDPAEALRHE